MPRSPNTSAISVQTRASSSHLSNSSESAAACHVSIPTQACSRRRRTDASSSVQLSPWPVRCAPHFSASRAAPASSLRRSSALRRSTSASSCRRRWNSSSTASDRRANAATMSFSNSSTKSSLPRQKRARCRFSSAARMGPAKWGGGQESSLGRKPCSSESRHSVIPATRSSSVPMGRVTSSSNAASGHCARNAYRFSRDRASKDWDAWRGCVSMVGNVTPQPAGGSSARTSALVGNA